MTVFGVWRPRPQHRARKRAERCAATDRAASNVSLASHYEDRAARYADSNAENRARLMSFALEQANGEWAAAATNMLRALGGEP